MAAHRMLLLDGAHRRRRERQFRDRPSPIDELREEKFIKKYRFDQESVKYITELIEEGLIRPTARNHALPAEFQVLVALKFFASGSIFDDIGDIFGLDKGTVSRIVHNVSDALAALRNEFICWPQSATQKRRIIMGMAEKANFPNCIGCVDGTHIRIQAPTPPLDYPLDRRAGYEAAFVCRKNYHSINVQGICDHQGKLRI